MAEAEIEEEVKTVEPVEAGHSNSYVTEISNRTVR